jgi:hypothetical protein
VGVALTVVSPTASSFADDPARAGIVIPVWLFIAGLLAGIFNYWIGGGVLFVALNLLGGDGSYRRARHLLALAAVPLTLSLLLLLVRLALYGGDVFRSGGSDSGTYVFTGVEVALGVWSLGLLTVGIRTVERWSWRRTLATVAVFAALALLADLALQLFG